MPVSFKDILEALEFVSAGGMGEHQAFLCKQSGRVYWHSEFSDELGELRCRSGSGGNSVGVVSVLNLESSGVGAPERRPRHDKRYHEV